MFTKGQKVCHKKDVLGKNIGEIMVYTEKESTIKWASGRTTVTRNKNLVHAEDVIHVGDRVQCVLNVGNVVKIIGNEYMTIDKSGNEDYFKRSELRKVGTKPTTKPNGDTHAYSFALTEKGVDWARVCDPDENPGATTMIVNADGKYVLLMKKSWLTSLDPAAQICFEEVGNIINELEYISYNDITVPEDWRFMFLGADEVGGAKEEIAALKKTTKPETKKRVVVTIL